MENSSFVQVMKDWRRMCKAYTTDDDSCCYGCPVVDFHEHGCGAIFEMDDGTDWERYEGQIREWAAEHPEPVYPTWGQYFRRYYGLEYCKGHEMLLENIPADLAEKLGLKPKEGV